MKTHCESSTPLPTILPLCSLSYAASLRGQRKLHDQWSSGHTNREARGSGSPDGCLVRLEPEDIKIFSVTYMGHQDRSLNCHSVPGLDRKEVCCQFEMEAWRELDAVTCPPEAGWRRIAGPPTCASVSAYHFGRVYSGGTVIISMYFWGSLFFNAFVHAQVF